MRNREVIKINLVSFDSSLADSAVREIMRIAKKTGATVAGPVPLPRRVSRFCVIRGPHVDKDSREHFELRSFSRLLFLRPTSSTVDALMSLNLSAGVDIKIAIKNGGKA
jgi:small subunit ribosomal protein S10